MSLTSDFTSEAVFLSTSFGARIFVCFALVSALSAEAAAQGGLKEMGAGWINSRGDFWLKSLRRQFGHVSEETTEIYLEFLTPDEAEKAKSGTAQDTAQPRRSFRDESAVSLALSKSWKGGRVV